MSEVNRQNACEKLTNKIIEQSKKGLENLTTKNVKWEKIVTPMLNKESNEAKKHMEALGKALSADISQDLSELINRSDNIKKSITEILKYSKTWFRVGAFTSVFFGTGTPTLWKNCLEELKKARQKAKNEINDQIRKEKTELKKQQAELKQQPGTLKPHNGIDSSGKMNEKKLTNNSSMLRSSSAPLPPIPHIESIPNLAPRSMTPPPPPPPLNAMPKIKNPEIKEIKKLIENLKKDSKELSEEEREIRIKAIKEKAINASEKYFGDKSPITQKVLRKPDVKKYITKISKKSKKEKEVLWPLLLAPETQYYALLKAREDWEKSRTELKEKNKDLYEKGKFNGTLMSDKNKALYERLKKQLDTAITAFVTKISAMKDSGESVYKSLFKLDQKDKPKQKKWYKGSYNWVENYLSENKKEEESYCERLKTFLQCELNKIENLEKLQDLKNDYEKLYQEKEALKEKSDKTKKEEKALAYFESHRSSYDKNIKEIQDLIGKYKDGEFKLELTTDSQLLLRNLVAFRKQGEINASLNALLQQLLTNLMPNVKDNVMKNNIPKLLQDVMNGTKKVVNIEKINLNPLKI